MRILPVLSAAFFCLISTPYSQADFEQEFGQEKGTFVLLDAQTNKTSFHNPERAKERFTPCSTFKIPNTLIALETKVLSSPDQKITWDKKKYPKETLFIKDWAKDMNLKDAFKLSCVWFYKEIADKVGKEKMDQYLNEFNYGNKDTSGGLTQFWLVSSLKISALEQIDFLRKMHERKFKLAPETYDAAENEIFIEEKTPEYTLRTKTGTGPLGNGDNIAWYVGYVTKGEKTWYFAMNIETKDMPGSMALRKKITRDILKGQGIIH